MKGNDARVEKFNDYLKELFPEPACGLVFKNPFQLLVATILSAQCTDKQVNKVTPCLFAKYPDAKAMAEAPLDDIENIIHSTGFFKNKAKNIKNASIGIMESFGGQIPDNMEQLTTLAGVGRKTANVVLGNAFGIPGMVVDTHVKRISNRFGLTKNSDPEKIEQDLMKIIPKEEWTLFSHRLVLFGRSVCDAKKPCCGECKVKDICPAAK